MIWFFSLQQWAKTLRNFIKPLHKLHHSHQWFGVFSNWLLHRYSPLSAPPVSMEVFRDFASASVAGMELVQGCPERCFVCRLLGPACGGLSVDVGKAGEMLRVFVLWVPAWAQWRVHVPRGGIAGWMHRRAGVTAVSWRHIWPPGGDRCRVQPRSAAHQTRLHPRHLAVELVLWTEKKKREEVMVRQQCQLLREA